MHSIPEQYPDTEDFVYTLFSEACAELNPAILQGFIDHRDDETIKRTHLFNGRYENIYLDQCHIPELEPLMKQACNAANLLLNSTDIRAGFWFNDMPPGSLTLPHRHDDDDELLSAAYYVSVPPESGELLIHGRNGPLHIQPRAGLFIFFKPDMMHEVSENRSDQQRLSIGINFGNKHRSDDFTG